MNLPACRAALDGGTSLARPLLRVPAAPGAEGLDSPDLALVRRWTEALCERARLAAGETTGGHQAIASLTTALALLQVWNDHSLIGEVICSSQERVVLEALRELAPLPSVDAGKLRAAVDPYLAQRPQAELVRTITIEADYWARALEGVLSSGEAVTPATMEALGFPGTNFLGASHALLDRHEGILDLRGDPCQARLGDPDAESADGPRLIFAVREWHSRNIRLALARVALGVLDQAEQTGAWPRELEELGGAFPDGLPPHPCGHLRFDYARAEPGFRLSSVDRRHPGRDAIRAAWIFPAGLGGR